MPKLNQKGVVHLLLPLILLAGIVAAVYLIDQGPNIFRSRANVSGPISGPINNVTLPSPIAYWRFDDTFQGSTVGEGNGSTGTWSGSGNHWTTGYHNGAGQFNGTNDYINIGTPTVLNQLLTADFTITGWINPSVTEGNIIARGDSRAALQNKLISVSLYQGKLYFAIRGDNGEKKTAYAIGTTTLSAGNWYHFAAVRKKGNYLQLFLNGGGDSSNVADTAGSVTFVQHYGPRALTLGVGGLEDVAGGYFNGLMDEIKIYNTVLSADQIAADMNTFSFTPPSGGYPTPSYSTPSYGTPSYSTPSYTTPSYPTPGSPSAAPNVDQRVAQLEAQLVGQQSALDKIISWIKTIFPGF